MNKLSRYAPTVVRLLMGLMFTVFGLNGFLHFLPQPPQEGAAAALFGGFVASGYMLPLISGTEVAGGLMLLGHRYVPLGLTLLAPLIVNIVAFHVFLAPPNPVTFFVLFAEVYLAWSYREHFRPMLSARAAPHVASPGPAVART